ncbi:hypothetical protein N658DRAFT_507665 [Parathielavia hyrcaniae]|uniref:Uncharacterized protein n=1 Tax=Parathielavia hyrcaniae TaxID=113614 RepID=A0AAN6T1J6_9PEZI|nr:hypothetical protein N658DRAFT_507665 [Parathielavia hyrcaniae]
MEVPNWLRIVLLLLSLVSFLPQLQRLYLLKHTSGLSLFYVLYHLVVATELFTVSFVFVVNYAAERHKPDIFVHDPLNASDKINLAQFTLVWVLWLMIFTLCLIYSSDLSLGLRIAVASLYISFLLISVAPAFIDAATDTFGGKGHDLVLGIFTGFHVFYVNPVVDLFEIPALYAQARITSQRAPGSGLGALSLLSVAMQAVLFALLAPAWLGRLAYPWERFSGGVSMPVVVNWFLIVGFVPFDYGVFAITQFVLLLIAVWRSLHHGQLSGVSAGETEPLLGAPWA